jgi:hypothetical protein
MLAVLISSSILAQARIASEIPLHFSYSNIIFLNENIILLYVCEFFDYDSSQTCRYDLPHLQHIQ